MLPIALWLHGEAAGAAAAMVLWVAGVVRHFSPGVSGALPIAHRRRSAAGALAAGSPLMIAAMAQRPDWDLAFIAAVGGGALMAYVTQARVSAAEAERALREARQDAKHAANAGAADARAGDDVAVVLIDRDGRVVAMSKASCREAGHVTMRDGQKFEDIVPLPRETLARCVRARAEPASMCVTTKKRCGCRRARAGIDWEARPWRDDGRRDLRRRLRTAATSLRWCEARTAAAANERALCSRARSRAQRGVGSRLQDASDLLARRSSSRLRHARSRSSNSRQHDTVVHEEDRAMLAAYFTDVGPRRERRRRAPRDARGRRRCAGCKPGRSACWAAPAACARSS